MFSMKRVAMSLASLGAVTVGAYLLVFLFGACNTNLSCSASVYFGLPQTEFVAPDISLAVKDTTVAVSPHRGVSFSDINEVVQIVGLYALLIGVFMLIVLELKELKLLKSRRRKSA
jgi:hypothetical protein